MLFSAFAPFGMFAFSSKPTHAESFYRAMVTSVGNVPGSDEAKGTISTAFGSRMEAKIYADAMAMARARYVLEHAGAQVLPECLTEMLSTREGEYKITPGYHESTPERRRTVAARMLLPRGAAKTEVENALLTLLGDDFIVYRPTPIDEAVVWPAALGDQPQNLQLPTVQRKLIRLTANISVGLGSPQYVRYERFVPDVSQGAPLHSLLIGDTIALDTGNSSLTETVTVTGLSFDEPVFEGPIYPTFEATFNNTHSAGAVGTTAPWPLWTSTKRLNLVVVTGSAALDPNVRRKINQQLDRQLRGVSVWVIAGETFPGSMTVGPFTVAGGQLGVTTIGLINL